MKIKKYWEIKNKKEDEKNIGEMYLYGDISSEKFWDDDITPKDIENQLKDIGSMDELNVFINSGGGSVFAGVAIKNIISKSDAKVKNVYINGLAASIASVIMLAGDNIYMQDGSFIMIHNPTAMAWGESKEMIRVANLLEKIKDTIVDMYKNRTGIEEKQISELMDKETWMNAEEAVDMGFADLHLENEIACFFSRGGDFIEFNGEKIKINRYKNIKKVLNNDTIKDKEAVNKIISEQKEKIKKLRIKLLGGN